MITERQRECLELLARGQLKGLVPSYGEMRDELGLASKSGINRIILNLEERDMIFRIPLKARAIELTTRGWDALKTNPNVCPCCGSVAIPMKGKIS